MQPSVLFADESVLFAIHQRGAIFPEDTLCRGTKMLR